MTQNRPERLERLRRKQRVDVLVVGGGINGISTFRELALQGVDVVLIDRADFMSGASAAPSRMIHGGLRYMENGEFALVKESLRERNALLANAPHYVMPLATLIPIADHFSGLGSVLRRFLGGTAKAGARGSLIVRLGLTLYDLYAGADRAMPWHRFIARQALRKTWPALRADIICAALYYDARITYPERLGIELIMDVEAEAPKALALNHVSLVTRDGRHVILRDSLTGEDLAIEPQIIVNASGAWIDATNTRLTERPPQLIGGTKGSHLVIANDELRRAVGDAMVYFANRDGRVCIVFAHLGQVLAGSTDIRVSSPEGVRCDNEESAYILGSLREVFPSVAVKETDIVHRFSGVRPLPLSATDVNAEISRDHRCEWLVSDIAAPIPVLNLIGGKWTTFRAFGAEAADSVLAKLGTRRTRSTKDMAIGGGKDFPVGERQRAEWIARVVASSGLAAGPVGRLLDRYGTRTRELIAGLEPDAALVSLPAHGRREIAWLIEREHVATLADLILRRLAIAMTGELSMAAVNELGEIAAAALDWDLERLAAEKAALLSCLERDHGLTAEMLRRRNIKEGISHVRQQEGADEPPVPSRQVS